MPAQSNLTSITLARVPAFRIGGLEVRPATREVIAVDWRDVLEPRVMQVFVALALNAGEVVSRDDLTMLCWEGRVVGDDALNRVIPKIRRLAARDGAELTLETIRKVGYRLYPAEPLSASVHVDQPAPEASSTAAPRWTRWPLMAAALSLAALTLWVAFASVAPTDTSPVAAAQSEPSAAFFKHAAFERHSKISGPIATDDAVIEAVIPAGETRKAAAPAVMTVRPTSDLHADAEAPGGEPSASGPADLGTGPISFLPRD